MRSFLYCGKLPASKSLWIRARLAQAYSPTLLREGETDCADARHFDASLHAISRGEVANCGEAGLGLRLLAFHAARLPGRHRIEGTSRLFSRPQRPLVDLLHRLGVDARLDRAALEIVSNGWQPPREPLALDRTLSSQFASAVLMNAWDLPFPLEVAWTSGERVSDGYWRMSVSFARRIGMVVDESEAGFRLSPLQTIGARSVAIEPDLSTTFTLAALAAVRGRATFLDFPERSLQPDARFVDILQAFGADVARGKSLTVASATRNPIDVDLLESPDLFPVLAVLAAIAPGTSRLHGAPHLIHKESDRLARTETLLAHLGRVTRRVPGGLVIEGRNEVDSPAFSFDALGDHRMAMAAAVAHHAGFSVDIAHPEAVEKSFPEFWSVLAEATQ